MGEIDAITHRETERLGGARLQSSPEKQERSERSRTGRKTDHRYPPDAIIVFKAPVAEGRIGSNRAVQPRRRVPGTGTRAQPAPPADEPQPEMATSANAFSTFRSMSATWR